MALANSQEEPKQRAPASIVYFRETQSNDVTSRGAAITPTPSWTSASSIAAIYPSTYRGIRQKQRPKQTQHVAIARANS